MKFFGEFTPPSVAISLFGLDIYWYSICILFGILSALFVSQKVLKEWGYDPDIAYDGFLAATFFGIIGARLYHVLSKLDYYTSYPEDILNFRAGGLGIYGGVLFGIIGIYIVSRVKKVPILSALSVGALVLPLGQAIGRFGNYFNQELFGFPTDLPWGIYIETAFRPIKYIDSSYFHPLFLYESLFSLALFFFLYTYRNILRDTIPGVYVVGYGSWRFFAEFLRNTETPTYIFRLEQWVSLCFILCGIVWIYKMIDFKKYNFQKNEKREKGGEEKS